MSTHQSAGGTTGTRFAALALAALGVVYGDIGTSPLYAVKEVFAGNHPIPVTTANIYGSLSLFFWALVIVVSVKYVTFIMRADNRGEGSPSECGKWISRKMSRRWPWPIAAVVVAHSPTPSIVSTRARSKGEG